MEAAKKNMVIWLSDPHELGREPRKIEYAGNFELHDMRYYFFKFKTCLLGPWLIGVSGGYESDTTLEPCGHTFSNMKNIMLPPLKATVLNDRNDSGLLDGTGETVD